MSRHLTKAKSKKEKAEERKEGAKGEEVKGAKRKKLLHLPSLFPF
jgi:hypothetical protein